MCGTITITMVRSKTDLKIIKEKSIALCSIIIATVEIKVIITFRGSSLIYILSPKLIYIWIADNFLSMFKAGEQRLQ